MKKNELSGEGRIAGFFASYSQWILIFAALGVLGGLSFAGYSWNSKRLELAAQNELFSLYNAIEKKQQKLEEEILTANEAAKTDKNGKPIKDLKKSKAEEKTLIKNPETLMAQLGEKIGPVESFIQNNPNRKASYIAAIQLAALATSYQDLPRAEKYLKDVVHLPPQGDAFAQMIRAQLTAVLMDQNKFDEAISFIKPVTENNQFPHFQPQALLYLATCHFKKGDYDQALASLNLVENEYPSTQAAINAKSLKKLVIMKQGSKT